MNMYLYKKHEDFPGNVKEKEHYRLELNEEFEGEELNGLNWLPYCYSCGMLMPTYEIRKGNLALQITEEQELRCSNLNDAIKCSSIQTGNYSGPLGNTIIAHAKNEYREETKLSYATYAPLYGYFEMRARMLITNSNTVSFRMNGYNSQPERWVEISILDVDGKAVKRNTATIGYGIRKCQGQKLKEEYYETVVDIDVSKFHCYAAEWDDRKISFYIDNKKIRQIDQSPDYPMQFMLGIFERPAAEKDIIDRIYPKELIIDYFRGYSKA